MTEAPRSKRETLRELYLKSGNLCAFLRCGARMVDPNGDFSDQLCHLKRHDEWPVSGSRQSKPNG